MIIQMKADLDLLLIGIKEKGGCGGMGFMRILHNFLSILL